MNIPHRCSCMRNNSLFAFSREFAAEGSAACQLEPSIAGTRALPLLQHSNSDLNQATDYEATSTPTSIANSANIFLPQPSSSCQHQNFCRPNYFIDHGEHMDSNSSSDHSNTEGDQKILTKYCLQFSQVLDTLRQSGLLCDVTLTCEGCEFQAHKVILASCCPYFHSMFLGNFPESKAERIELQGITAGALGNLIGFMYTTYIHLCRDNVEGILAAANLLQMDVVKELCCQLLFTQLAPITCLQIWHVADLYSCYDLRQKVEAFTQEHFTELIHTSDFLLISKERLEKIISSDSLTVESEEKVFEALMMWTKHDNETRSQHLPELLQHIRLSLVPMKYLVLQVKEEPLISKSLECSKLVMNAMSYLMLKDSPTQSDNSLDVAPLFSEMKPRVAAGVEQVMMVFGGEDEAALATLESYSFKEKNWQPAQSMPIFLSKAGCVVLNGKVYLIGGHYGSRHLRTVVCYDPMKDSYSYVASMHYVRSEVGAGVLDGKIYAVGGYDGSNYLRTAECYDPVTNRWKMIAPMPGGKSAVGIGCVNGLLYVLGGIDRDVLVGTMECYNPKTDSWITVAGVKCPKKYVGVAEVGGCLYLAGGRYSDDSSSLKVHCFDPKTNKLKQVKDMPCTFPSPSLLASNGILYVDGRIKFLSYNPANDTWTELRGKSIYRHHSMAAVVERPIRHR